MATGGGGPDLWAAGSNGWRFDPPLDIVAVVRLVQTNRVSLDSSFWALWRANSLSGLGDGVVLVALPLLAARLTGNAFLVSLVVVMQRLPWAVVAIPVGAYVDRKDPARAMIAADLARGLLLGVVSVLVVFDELSILVLCGAALAVGVFDTVFAGAAQAMIPRLVDDDDRLDVANSRLTAAQTTTGHFIGPAIGGVLFSVNRALPFVVDAVSFVTSARILVTLRGRANPEPRSTRRSLRADMAEGMVFFRRSSLLPILATLTAGLALFQAAVLAPFVLFALHDLHLSRAGYGVFLAVTALGNVFGGLIAPRLRHYFSTATILSVGGAVAGVAYLVVAVTSSVVIAQVAFVLEASAVAAGTVASISLRQRHIPRPLMGRVSNVFRSIIWGAIPVGALAGGLLAEVRSLRAPFLVAGVAQIVLVAVTAWPLQRRVQATEGRPGPPIGAPTMTARP
jgi:MFS family permease